MVRASSVSNINPDKIFPVGTKVEHPPFLKPGKTKFNLTFYLVHLLVTQTFESKQ